jgi:pheromone shutdown protein TraB
MRMACDLAKGRLELIDREIRITLKRAWGRVGFFGKLWLASSLMASLLVHEEITADEIERIKNGDVLEDLFKQLPRRFDKIRETIIGERDRYMALRLVDLAGQMKRGARRSSILAVVGAGHVAGMAALLEERDGMLGPGITELEDVPRRGLWQTLVPWVTFSAFFGAISFLVGRDGWQTAIPALAFSWVATRSLGAGAGALVARAHPLTILVTVLVAPFAFFVAIFGPRLWMFAALTELRFHKPRVEDFERIAADTEDWNALKSGIYANRVLRLFLIIVAVSLGLSIGNLVFLKVFISAGLAS